MSEQQLHHVLEAILYASGKWVTQEELQKLSRTRDTPTLIEALHALQQRYKEQGGPVQLENDCERWKLNVTAQFFPYIKKVVTQTELTKSVLETLAIIAVRVPAKQSDIIKIRTNKGYDHLALLENEGYITRKKEGRTKRILLAEKFYAYFDIPKEKLDSTFNRARELETSVKATEQRVGEKLEVYERTQEELKQSEEERKKLAAKTTEDIKDDVADLKKKINETPEILNTIQTLPEEPEPVPEEPKKKRGRQTKQKEEEQTPAPAIEPREELTSVKEETPEIIMEKNPEEISMTEKTRETEEVENAQPEEKETLGEEEKPEEEQTVETETPTEEQPEETATPTSNYQSSTTQQPTLEQRTGLFSKGITPEVQKIIDEKANELMGKEKDEGVREETASEKEKKEDNTP